ncbi:MAG: 16S rRNA (cytidine(1402)-2'-O)-methyltransferase [bacterium]|nr:16S rRNA (cytidine(1402)-2'-O)-methyltransferase [bacterium]
MNDEKNGCLYLISTPIGNLKDITFRALETLQQVDYLLCEDTRHSLKLLNHYNIKKHLESYFVGNERHKTGQVIQDLLSGKQVGLISDGGTPCISDPGNYLVHQCHEHRIRVIPIPGVSGLATALSLTGIADKPSLFIGFLPRSPNKINRILMKIKDFEGNIILYESPYRVIKLLKILHEKLGNVKLFLFKELTKVFESIKLGHITDILDDIGEQELKGEYVIIISAESRS